jgi:heme O synthase-like polyprenyltransferase
MSSLRYRLRKLLPSLSAEANRTRDREIKERYYDLRGIAGSEKSVKSACEKRGVSQDYFELWAKRLLKLKSLLALKSRSKAPHHSPNQMVFNTGSLTFFCIAVQATLNILRANDLDVPRRRYSSRGRRHWRVSGGSCGESGTEAGDI